MDDREVVLEQYKAYIDNMNNVSNKAGAVHTLYFSLIGAAFAIISLAESGKIFNSLSTQMIIIAGLVGILICLIWWKVIMFYGSLFDTMFKNLRDMEKNLVAQPYTQEYERLKQLYRELNNDNINRILNKLSIFIRSLFNLKEKSEEEQISLRKREAYIPICFGIVFAWFVVLSSILPIPQSPPIDQQQCPICPHSK